MAKKFTAQELRDAMTPLKAWIESPDSVEQPPRQAMAHAVRTSLGVLENDAPGHSIEMRVPPFGAVQVVQGSHHRRGTPPNVVELTPQVWLRLASGLVSWAEVEQDPLSVISGAHADEVAPFLPLLKL